MRQDDRTYERIADDERNSRRTIADAIEVFGKSAGFTEHDRAKVWVERLRLPSRQSVGLVDVLFEAPSAVSFAPSQRVKALSAGLA